MRTLLLTGLLTFTAIAGCSKADKTEKTEKTAIEADLPTITIDELDARLASGDCKPIDANGEATRKKMGVIPGAVLLTDSTTFATTELPADKSKTLVFYCANTHCDASHDAAQRALTAGYSNVKVLPDGIAGWVKAGKKVANI